MAPMMTSLKIFNQAYHIISPGLFPRDLKSHTFRVEYEINQGL